MNDKKKIEKLKAFAEGLRKISADEAMCQKARQSILSTVKSQIKPSAHTEQNIWRTIMKTKIAKFAAAAVLIIAIVVGVNMLNGTPAWAVGQSIKALENVETAIVSGEFHDGGTINFTIHVKGEIGNWDSFRGYGESDEIVFMIRNKIAYQYWRGSKEIYSYSLEATKGKGIGSKLWYSLMKNLPWVAPIAPTMVKAAKILASDWEEIYTKDEQTKRECVFVTGSYKPLSTSFQIVFDLETKLIVRAKYWDNADRKGIPGLNIKNIVYNEEIPDEIFDLEQYTGAIVVNEEGMKKRLTLWQEAISLEDKKQYTEAIKVFQQLYDEYPHFIKTPEALLLIAYLYRDMEQYDKAVEYFEKVPREYSAPRYAVLDAHLLLGHCYMTMGQDAKALKAFQKCLELIREWDPKGLEWKAAKDLIEKYIREINNKK